MTEMNNPYDQAGVEPSLEDILSDPLTRLVMKRDGVTDNVLSDVITLARKTLNRKHLTLVSDYCIYATQSVMRCRDGLLKCA